MRMLKTVLQHAAFLAFVLPCAALLIVCIQLLVWMVPLQLASLILVEEPYGDSSISVLVPLALHLTSVALSLKYGLPIVRRAVDWLDDRFSRLTWMAPDGPRAVAAIAVILAMGLLACAIQLVRLWPWEERPTNLLAVAATCTTALPIVLLGDERERRKRAAAVPADAGEVAR